MNNMISIVVPVYNVEEYCLPMSQTLTDEQVMYVIEAINEWR